MALGDFPLPPDFPTTMKEFYGETSYGGCTGKRHYRPAKTCHDPALTMGYAPGSCVPFNGPHQPYPVRFEPRHTFDVQDMLRQMGLDLPDLGIVGVAHDEQGVLQRKGVFCFNLPFPPGAWLGRLIAFFDRIAIKLA